MGVYWRDDATITGPLDYDKDKALFQQAYAGAQACTSHDTPISSLMVHIDDWLLGRISTAEGVGGMQLIVLCIKYPYHRPIASGVSAIHQMD